MKLLTVKRMIVAAVFLIAAGFVHNGQAAQKAGEPVEMAAWLVYWDLPKGLDELRKMDNLQKLCYFAANFTEDDKLFMPEELKAALEKTKDQTGYEKYLTVVNDFRDGKKGMRAKDIEVLRRVLANDLSMDAHIEEILALAENAGCDGIEIDYENFWRDGEVAEKYLQFIGRLYEKTVAGNLKMRVVLEPRAPFADDRFVSGPEYVVMFYNLYGTHSITPGPKANDIFIRRVLKQMAALPAPRSAAFSTGGCVWGPGSERRFLTERQAAALAAENYTVRGRDEKSQCVVFNYVIDSKVYKIWYADARTLRYWVKLAKEDGIDGVSLWRLGGNRGIQRVKA